MIALARCVLLVGIVLGVAFPASAQLVGCPNAATKSCIKDDSVLLDTGENLDEALAAVTIGGGPMAACRTGLVRGGEYEATTNSYGWTCANYPWSAERGGIASGVASYLAPTTSGGNAYWLTGTGVGTGTDELGRSYDVNRELQIGAPTDQTATGGTASAPPTVVDTGVAMTTNLYRDHVLRVTGGACNGQKRAIVSNTATVLTVDGNWTSCTPDSTTTYTIYDPIPAAVRHAGVHVRVNAMADIMLAQDHLRPGGTVYFPSHPGALATVYLDRGCGRKGNAEHGITFAGCPVLRFPQDQHHQRRIQRLGMKNWKGDGIDSDLEQNGMVGVWMRLDKGSAEGHTFQRGFDGADGFQFSGHPIMSGAIGATSTTCTPNSSGFCQPASGLDYVAANQWGRLVNLNGQHTTPVTTPSGFCVSDADSESGVCKLDRRIACTADAGCNFSAGPDPDRGDLGPCENASEAIESIDAKGPGDTNVPEWVIQYRREIFPESGTLVASSESGYGVISDGTTNACGNGDAVTFTNWPLPASRLQTATGFMYPIDQSIFAHHGAVWSDMVVAANNYYGFDADGDGISDPGDCLSAATTSLADDEPECDTGDGLTPMAGDNGVIRNVISAYWGAGGSDGDDGRSALDGDIEGRRQKLEQFTLTDVYRGPLTDLSDVIFENVVFKNFVTGAGVNVGFTSNGEAGNFRIENGYAFQLIRAVSGHQLRIHDVDIYNSKALYCAIRIDLAADGLQIDHVRFSGVDAPWVCLWPDERFGPISIHNLTGTGRNVVGSATTASNLPNGFILLTRGDADVNSFNSEMAEVTISDVDVDTVTAEACLVSTDDAVPPNSEQIDVNRSRFTIRDSSIQGLNGTTGQRVVCNDVMGGTGEVGATPRSDASDDQGILNQRYVPVMLNNSANGVAWPDQPYRQVAEASVANCSTAGAMGGVVVHIFDDTAAGACADTAGNFTGGGTARSICKCNPTTGLWDPL